MWGIVLQTGDDQHHFARSVENLHRWLDMYFSSTQLSRRGEVLPWTDCWYFGTRVFRLGMGCSYSIEMTLLSHWLENLYGYIPYNPRDVNSQNSIT
jgi:hypothetical protein